MADASTINSTSGEPPSTPVVVVGEESDQQQKVHNISKHLWQLSLNR
jgi:hypothetical protein